MVLAHSDMGEKSLTEKERKKEEKGRMRVSTCVFT